MRLLKFIVVMLVILKMVNYFNKRFYNINTQLEEFDGSAIHVQIILVDKIIYDKNIDDKSAPYFYKKLTSILEKKYIIENVKYDNGLILTLTPWKNHQSYEYPVINWSLLKTQPENQKQESKPPVNYNFYKNIITIED